MERLDAKIAALAASDNPTPAVKELSSLLETPCFEIANGDSPELDPDSGYALQQWWKEAGGRWWIEHYLELTKPRATEPTAVGPLTVIAPSVRKTLSLETRPGHPLSPLLCSVTDTRCARETLGWRRRADHYLEQFAEQKHAAWLRTEQSDPPPPSIPTCQAAARAEASAGKRYDVWRNCLAQTRPAQTKLALGRLKAPHSGWFILRGRRGHYGFCDEVRAYDLATGAARIEQSCSALALRSGGSVDQRQTDAGRKRLSMAGSLQLDALREAAWMTLMATEAQSDVVEAWGFAIPDRVEPESSADRSIGGSFSFSASSAQTTLDFSYVVAGKVIVSGALTYPEDYNDGARDHAIRLLQIAEASFVAGCPKAAPPTAFALGLSKSGVSALDADPRSRGAIEQGLLRALGKGHAAACKGKAQTLEAEEF